MVFTRAQTKKIEEYEKMGEIEVETFAEFGCWYWVYDNNLNNYIHNIVLGHNCDGSLNPNYYHSFKDDFEKAQEFWNTKVFTKKKQKEYEKFKYRINKEMIELKKKEIEEEEEPYCFKDTTIDTVENDICFCSVGGCVKPTEFD